MAILYAEPGGDHGLTNAAACNTGGIVSLVNGTAPTYTTSDNAGAGHLGCYTTTSGAAVGGSFSNYTASGLFVSTLIGRASTYFKIPVMPTSATTQIVGLNTGGFQLRVGVNTTGFPTLITGTATVMGTGTVGFAANTWVRISTAWNITSATVYTAKVWVNGVLSLTVTNGVAIGTTTSNLVGYGWITQSPGAINQLILWSDMYVDDLGTLADTGNVRVTPKRPIALGATNAWNTLTGAAANRWGYINERPINNANLITHSVGATLDENFTVQAANVGDVDVTNATLLGGLSWVWGRQGAVAGTVGVWTPGGLVTGIAMLTTNAAYGKAWTSSAYPSVNTACGMRSNASNATFMVDGGLLLAYIPGVAAILPRNSLTLMGMGI